MSDRPKLIHLKDRRKNAGADVEQARLEEKANAAKANPATAAPSSPSEIIDFTDRQREKQAGERRRVTRTVLSQFMGVFVVLPNKGLQPVSLYDISEGGLAFDLPGDLGQFNSRESVTMRIYLSHDSYFSYTVLVANTRAIEDKGVVRHGATFQKSEKSYKSLFHFVKFLESVATVIRQDGGDRLITQRV